MTAQTVQTAVRRAFTDAGVRGWLHAARIEESTGTPAEVCVDADDTLALASVYKLPLMVAFARAVDDGDIDPTARTTLPADGRGGGSAGVSLLHDPVTMSWRDLVMSMIAMSDNAAADAVFRKVGARRVARSLAELGLARTVVGGDSRHDLELLLASTGTTSALQAFRVLADPDRALDPVAYRALSASSSTPREITALLIALWTDRAATAEQCAFARDALSRRVGAHRLRLGFPLDSVTVAEKSGTLGALRHSVGVVQFPGESAYAVSVFTSAARADRTLPAADAAIGAAAKIAVDALRATP